MESLPSSVNRLFVGLDHDMTWLSLLLLSIFKRSFKVNHVNKYEPCAGVFAKLAGSHVFDENCGKSIFRFLGWLCANRQFLFYSSLPPPFLCGSAWSKKRGIKHINQRTDWYRQHQTDCDRRAQRSPIYNMFQSNFISGLTCDLYFFSDLNKYLLESNRKCYVLWHWFFLFDVQNWRIWLYLCESLLFIFHVFFLFPP